MNPPLKSITALVVGMQLAASPFSLLSAKEVALVNASEPVASIIVAKDASKQERRAAEILQSYIERSTGAVLPVKEEGEVSEEGAVGLHVGKTALAKPLLDQKLDVDGFLLKRVSENAFVIVGGGDWGTEFGVYEFLERYLQVRWLAPTDLFTVVPKRETFFLPDGSERVEPAFLSREFFPIEPDRKKFDERLKSPSMAPYLQADAWGRHNKLRARVDFHHNLKELLPSSKYGKSNPEFYPVVEGQRRVPPDANYYQWQPNFSAPGIVEAAANEIIAYFEENPEAESYSFGVNDSHYYDESEASRARRKGGVNSIGLEDISDDYYQWVSDIISEVRVKYPDKHYGLLAYLGVIDPPTKATVDSAIVPYITYELSRWKNPEAREIMQGFTEKWKPVVPTLGWYDYVYGYAYLVPRSFPNASKEALKWGYDNNVRHYYGEAVPNWGEGPSLWLITRLLWNPNLNADDLLNEWCAAAVGKKAGPKLKEFYAVWERFWEKDVISSPWYSTRHLWLAYSDPLYLSSVPLDYVERADQLMSEAVALAGSPEEKARAEALQAMWKIYQTSVIAWHGDIRWNDAHLRSEAEALKWFDETAQTIAIAKERQGRLGRMSSDPLFAHSIYRIASTPSQGDTWGTAPLWPLLPWVRKSEAVREKFEALAKESGELPEPHNSYIDSKGPEVKMTHKAPLFAQMILDSAAGKSPQLLRNSSFESGLAGWNAGPFKLSKEYALDGEASLQVACRPETVLRQAIPYAPGFYHAEVSFFTPKDAQPGDGKVTVELLITNNKGQQMGPLPPKAFLTPQPGEWVTTVFTLDAPQFPHQTEHLSVIIRTPGFPEGQSLYFDDIKLTLGARDAKEYRGVTNIDGD